MGPQAEKGKKKKKPLSTVEIGEEEEKKETRRQRQIMCWGGQGGGKYAKRRKFGGNVGEIVELVMTFATVLGKGAAWGSAPCTTRRNQRGPDPARERGDRN